MFIILGGDGKEYGPESIEQIQNWIKEGRVDADTPIKKQGESDWKKMGDYPELKTSSAPAATGTSSGSGIDIGDALSKGFSVVIQNPVPAIAGGFLIFLIAIIIQIPSFVGQFMAEMASGDAGVVIAIFSGLLGLVTGIVGIVLAGPLYGGFYYFMLRMLRGEKVEILDVLAGFKKNVVQLILGGIVSSILITVGMFLCILPGIYLAVSYAFALPLIIDKEMGFWDAMEMSRKKVGESLAQWFMMLVFLILVSIIAAVGFLLCGIGALFTIPVAAAMVMCVYESLFGRA